MEDISIHAPAKGATEDYIGYGSYTLISIHAPAKGATLSFVGILWSAIFQSTLPRRERRCRNAFGCYPDNFNPRSREGSDKTHNSCSNTGKYFNPRSREGSDKSCVTISGYIIISIQAPAKGATSSNRSCQCSTRIFQSTLPRRERQQRVEQCEVYLQISIHAPAKGATPLRILSI